MERRKVLLGSGTLFTTLLAGCIGDGDLGDDNDTDEDDGTNGDDNDTNGHDDDDDYDDDDGYDDDDDHDDKEEDEDEDDDDEEEQENIPGFDRDNFELDSDVIEIKELTYQDNRLTVRVMLLTSDRDELAEELEELAPAFERAIRDADADEFFAEVHELEFSLYDEDKNTRFAVFMDIRWLQQFVDDDVTSDEFVDELLDQMGEVADEMDDD